MTDEVLPAVIVMDLKDHPEALGAASTAAAAGDNNSTSNNHNNSVPHVTVNGGQEDLISSTGAVVGDDSTTVAGDNLSVMAGGSVYAEGGDSSDVPAEEEDGASVPATSPTTAATNTAVAPTATTAAVEANTAPVLDDTGSILPAPTLADTIVGDRKRGRSSSNEAEDPDRHHHHHHHHHHEQQHHDAHHSSHRPSASKHHVAEGSPTGSSSNQRHVLSAAQKATSELSEDCCVRLGVLMPHHRLSREDYYDEMDAIRMTGVVERITVDDYAPGRDRYCWANIFFNSRENADIAASELNIPLRKSKWRHTVTQRLPLVGPNSGELGTIPAFQPFEHNPADTVVVDTQEGYIAFSTDELYQSKSAGEFMEAKGNGRLIRRLICKHFDPERRIPCRYGTTCSFMHIKGQPMNRLLKTVSHKAPLRFTKSDEDIQVGTWDYERRHDTLIVRHLEDSTSYKDLLYMFEGCVGFRSCHLFATKDESGASQRSIGSRYGVVRFDSKASAMKTLMETFDSNLSIGFYGVMEDCRRMQMRDAKERNLIPTFDTHNQTHLFFNHMTNTVMGGGAGGGSGSGSGYGGHGNNSSNHQMYNNRNNRGGMGGHQPNRTSYQGGRDNNNYNNRNSSHGNNNDDHHHSNNHQNASKGPVGYGSAEEGHHHGSASTATTGAGTQSTSNVPTSSSAATAAKRYDGSNSAGGDDNPNANTNSGGAAAQPKEKEAVESAPPPFPPLPSGWGYGVSRRTGKYFFFEHGSKAPTTFKHPTTGVKY